MRIKGDMIFKSGLICLSVAFASYAADTVSLVRDGHAVLTYQQTPNPNKVYISELYSPSGVQVLLDSPPDHVHHHGLMLGLDVDNVSFWLDGKESGSQRPRGACEATADALSQVVEWVTADGRILLVETRRITVHPVAKGAYTLITWHSQLTPAEGVAQVNLFTKLHYAGLGLRLPKAMDGRASFAFVNEGKSTPVRNSEKVTPADCAACTGTLDGEKRVTVAMFSAPQAATQWFTMSDSLTYISATKNYYRCPEILRAGQTLEFKYGVAVWDGEVQKDTLAEACATWAKLAGPPAVESYLKNHFNVATPACGATVYGSSVFGEGYEAAKAIDGKWAVRETDKWNSKADIIPHYLTIDLGQPRTIDCIRIVHEGLLSDGGNATTSDFRLQGSFRQWGPFTELTPAVRDNTLPISVHTFAPQKVRFVRVLIETAEQNNKNQYGRIFEVEVYSPTAGEQ